ncbi:helix-turn-helix domain-containing protein [Arachidicoccus sp.]|uniref:helix-turn-helix domain-containing protein n=1 Tax=Arachidicoccus sp. TaxID=1872624 RepID=UPI003D21B173
MKVYSEEELQLVNIYIGLSIKLGRLKQGLSQLQFAILVETNNTNIGRIERAEHYTGWDKILLLTQYLNLDFCSLLTVKTKKDLLGIVEECYKLEGRLTKEKNKYYIDLHHRIEGLHKKILANNKGAK